ncbi:MAG: hypothetical protein KDB53_08310, partial [Planctomycetes bacterium]|nr:hypothetical protein [Planctomycetota bacterium]
AWSHALGLAMGHSLPRTGVLEVLVMKKFLVLAVLVLGMILAWLWTTDSEDGPGNRHAVDHRAASRTARDAAETGPEPTPPDRASTADMENAATGVGPQAPLEAVNGPRLAGTVMSEDGRPLAGARVGMLAPVPPELDHDRLLRDVETQFVPTRFLQVVTTDRLGHYVFEHRPSPRVAVAFFAAGHATRVVVNPDIARPLDLRLDRSQAARVVAVDEQGLGIPGAEFAISHGVYGLSFDTIVELVNADANGEVELDDEFSFAVSIRAPGFATVWDANIEPGPRDALGRYVVTLRKGRSLRIETRPVGDARPLAGLRLLLLSENYRELVETSTEGWALLSDVPPLNQLDVSVLNDDWTVAALGDRSAERYRSLGTPFPLPRTGDADLIVPVSRGRTIRGVVVDEFSNQPLPGVEVELTPDPRRGWGDRTVVVLSASEYAVETTDDQGRFEFHGRPHGGLRVGLPGSGRVLRTRDLDMGTWGSSEGWGGLIRVRPSLAPSVEGLVLRVVPAATLAGVVVDEAGEPVAGARVTLDWSAFPKWREVQETRRGASFFEVFGSWEGKGDHRSVMEDLGWFDDLQALTDDSGRFRLEGLPPVSGLSLIVRHPDHLRGTCDGLEPGDHSARITLRKGPRTRVRLVDDEGEPVPGVGVWLDRLALPAFRALSSVFAGTTDRNGCIEIGAAPPGLSTIRLSQNPRHLALPFGQPVPIKIAAEGMNDYEVTLRRLPTLSLRIVLEDGSPLADALATIAPEQVDQNDVERLCQFIPEVRGFLMLGANAIKSMIQDRLT